MHALLSRVVAGENLSRVEAAAVMRDVMEGNMTESQMGGLLTALRMKGETVEEITGFAQTMREKALRVTHQVNNAVDTCGTGGDGGKTFNVSTATALVATSLGVPVAKHGNRSVSSQCGSADVLAALGIEVQMSPEEAKDALEKVGLCFMFAPNYHQSFKYVTPTRKELGFRTCFNMLGPLTNPAGVKRQLIGVYSRDLTEPLALVLKELGLERAMVVSSEDGLDEISVSAPTQVSELVDGQVQTYTITPGELGLDTHALASVAGGNAEENATLFHHVFTGKRGAARDIVVANTGAVLVVAGQADSLSEGVRKAEYALDHGLVTAKLQEVVAFTGGRTRVS